MPHDITERAYQLALSVLTLKDDAWFRDIVRRELVRQLVRSGSSVGANLTEASAAQTKPDFIAKVAIAKKEAFETQYWLRLGVETGVLSRTETALLTAEAASIGQVVSASATGSEHPVARCTGHEA